MHRLLCALLLVGSTALAQAPDAGKGPPPAPKPSEKMKDMKWLEGKWKCTGTVTMPGGAPPMEVKATYTVKSDLDGYWLAGRMSSPKTKAMPMSHVEQDYWTFNETSQTWLRLGMDNFGDWSQATAAPGDKLEFKGAATMMAQTVQNAPYQSTFTKQSPKELKIDGTIGAAPGPVIAISYTCKK